jgi:CPA2 family monovalent cation:H+ antiporter-2
MEIASSIVPLLILLATGIVAAILSRLLRISPIVGYLILGAAVSAIRPDLLSSGGTVRLLADLGVVFLLFDIGLHFSIAHVREEAADIFGFGPLQVAASALLLGAVAWAFGSPPLTGFIVGATLALSSTAIVVGVIAERRQQNCPVALTATAILIFQDIAAIFLLILASTLDRGGALLIMLGAVAKTIVAVSLSIVTARFIVRPLFVILSRYGGEEVFTATALLIALAAGWGAEMAGLSMTLGAFLGGMIVAQSPFKASIRSEIGPFRGLLVSFFFISVGASLDRSAIVAAWPAILALAGGIVMMKSIGNVAASLAFRWSVPGSIQLGVLLAGSSEFAFVIFAMPGVRKSIGPTLVTELTAAVALTLALTPALGFLGRTAAGRLRLRAERRAQAEMIPVGETNPVLLIGMGDVGRTIADALEEFDIGYDAIERNATRLRRAVADGYNAFFGDAGDTRLWRVFDIAGRKYSVMTAGSLEAAQDWIPFARTMFPQLHRLWVARTDDEAAQLNELGLEAVVAKDEVPGIEAAELLLAAFGIAPERISSWSMQQRARIASPFASAA